MSKSEYYTILTKIGIAKFIAARASGNGVNLKSFKLSSKVILPSEEMQSLEEIVYEANISSKSVDESNPNYVNLMCHVPSDVGGFEVNAVGIYDEVGDLLAVGNVPRTYKPILKEGSAKELMIKIVMELSNAEEVILKLDPSVIMASRDYVDAIKLELELRIEALEEELKVLINTKENKGVAADLDSKLRAELIALINKKENIGVAKSLVDALRKELQASSKKLSIKDFTITATYTGTYANRTLKSVTGFPSGMSEETFKSKCVGYTSPPQSIGDAVLTFNNVSTSVCYGLYENDSFSCGWLNSPFSYPKKSGATNNNNY
ncbi:phage tail protein [Campylobacter jejuni]|uniref:phage tail protein n=1 Tax=Campylobacter jejuni TaxID=197 RepID=UPI000577AAC4